MKKLVKPYVKSFDDYHEIEEHVEHCKSIIKSIKGVEINPKDYGYEERADSLGYVYYGLFYVGVRPSKTEIQKLLSRKISWQWQKQSASK